MSSSPKKKKTKKASKKSSDDWVQDKKAEEPLPSIKILQREIRSLKRKLLENSGKEELIRETCRGLYRRPPELVLPPIPKPTKRGVEMVAAAHISDTQLGKHTIDYDPAVAATRLNLYVQKVIEITEIQRSSHKIDELHLWLGGDMVEGEYGNYPSQPYDVTSSVIRQAMREAPDIFEELIYALLKYFKRIHIGGVPGNHGRGASFKATRHNETNWDRVFYWLLRDRLLGSDLKPDRAMRKRITFDVPEGDQFWIHDRILGWGNLIVHGDQIRGWAGIPFYGVQKKSHGWADSMPNDWDNLFFGHFHTLAAGTINFRRWFCNGTTESSATYALEALAAAGTPCQRLVYFTEQHGIVSDHPIYLDGVSNRPILQRKLRQAGNELGEVALRKMMEALFRAGKDKE